MAIAVSDHRDLDFASRNTLNETQGIDRGDIGIGRNVNRAVRSRRDVQYSFVAGNANHGLSRLSNRHGVHFGEELRRLIVSLANGNRRGRRLSEPGHGHRGEASLVGNQNSSRRNHRDLGIRRTKRQLATGNAFSRSIGKDTEHVDDKRLTWR